MIYMEYALALIFISYMLNRLFTCFDCNLDILHFTFLLYEIEICNGVALKIALYSMVNGFPIDRYILDIAFNGPYKNINSKICTCFFLHEVLHHLF